MRSTLRLPLFTCAALGAALATYACKTDTDGSSDAPTGSEVAVSVVSGALNNTSGGSVAFSPRKHKSSALDKTLKFLSPVSVASAAEWSCSGASLSPAFAGPKDSPYAYTPPSCSVTWSAGDTDTSTWSGAFNLAYGASCDAISARPFLQSSGCEITRTTSADGNIRKITGPLGNSYAITHDTNGAGTGWDSSISPAPSDDGVQLICGGGGCASEANLIVNGSHLTGTVTVDGLSATVWDHTVTTESGGLSVTGTNGSYSVNGKVTVQHNILHYVSTTSFNDVTYGDSSCCFPTAGSVSTTFSEGADVGKTESISFTSTCGETTLTGTDGTTASLMLTQCL